MRKATPILKDRAFTFLAVMVSVLMALPLWVLPVGFAVAEPGGKASMSADDLPEATAGEEVRPGGGTAAVDDDDDVVAGLNEKGEGGDSADDESGESDESGDFDQPNVPTGFRTDAIAPGRGGGITIQSVRPVQPTHTYVFHANGSVFETTILKGGEVLAEPANPTQPGKRFDGWFVNEACTQAFTGFGKPAAALDNGTTDLWAKFSDVHYFTYHDEHGKVIETEVVELDQQYTFHAQWPAFELDSDTARNDGWKDQNGAAYADLDRFPEGQTITVKGDLDLYPVPQEGFYVHFHGQGGSSTVSQFVHEGGKAVQPAADPTRKGYRFAGWYDAAEGGSVFDFDKVYSTVPSSSVEVYAHWTPAQTEYVLVYMVEDPDHGDEPTYSFYNSVQKTGTTGERVVLDSDDLNYGKVQVEGIDQYFVNLERTGEMPVIKADGSTELIVYCDLWYYNLSYNGRTERIRCGQTLKPVMDRLGVAGLYSDGYRLLLYPTNGSTSNYAEIINYVDKDEQGAFYAQYRLRSNVTFTQYSRTYSALGQNEIWDKGQTFRIDPEQYYKGNSYTQYWMLESIDSTDAERKYTQHERTWKLDADNPNPSLDYPSDYPPFTFDKAEGHNPVEGNKYQFVFDGDKPQPVYLYFSRGKFNLVFEENGGRPPGRCERHLLREAPRQAGTQLIPRGRDEERGAREALYLHRLVPRQRHHPRGPLRFHESYDARFEPDALRRLAGGIPYGHL